MGLNLAVVVDGLVGNGANSVDLVKIGVKSFEDLDDVNQLSDGGTDGRKSYFSVLLLGKQFRSVFDYVLDS